MKLFLSNDKSEYPSFPVIFNEYFSSDNYIKKGNGNMTINKGSVSIWFSDKLFLSKSKNAIEYLIEKINYKFENNIFEIELLGQFTEDIKIKKNKIDKDSNHSVKIFVKNNQFSMFINSNENEIKIIEKSFSSNDFKN